MTRSCLPGMIITAVGGGGDAFRATITAVQYLTGAIQAVSITQHGTGYSSNPQLVVSSAACRCNNLPGTVAGNFDACLSPRRAYGASIGSRVAHGAILQGFLPRFHVSDLLGIQNSDTEEVPLQRYGYEYADGSHIFGSYGKWIKFSHTLELQLRGAYPG